LLAATTVAACAVAPVEPKAQLGSRQVSPEMLLQSSPLAAGIDYRPPTHVNILEVTPEMAAFLDEHVGNIGNRLARMKRLAQVVLEEDYFHLVYDDSTRTAQETFQIRRGNCLSFTNMFIAMARYLDIKADYQEVETPPEWSIAGESFLFSQHVNVHVDLGSGLIQVVDFFGYDTRTPRKERMVSDERGRAHYFNNVGVDYMLGGDTPQAFVNFRNSLGADGAFVSAWINLGILHRRAGLPAWAEAAYQTALDIEPSNLVAMSNLASLYEQEGYAALAAFYDERVEAHRMGNPYYRYKLAQAAVLGGDYVSAIENLEHAIEALSDEPRFYSLLSVSYLMSGDHDQALQWMKKAESLAVQDMDRKRYQNKLQWLMSQQAEK
jgi:Tfp pilus assembly protein PilF